VTFFSNPELIECIKLMYISLEESLSLRMCVTNNGLFQL